ncbi:discoidin domain-containing protein [Kitasatospora sp. NPDC058162]|uniref:discoidin domain-containing protein n=1 Tax=Kitasatospora sp. NPDC058162 TaxID=3346362 RepID=UPI0036D9A5C7
MPPTTDPDDELPSRAPHAFRLETTTVPRQFTTSTATEDKTGDIHFTLRHTTTGFHTRCGAITVTVPVGDKAADLTARPADIHAVARDTKGTPWRVERATSAGAATFTCVPDNPTESVVFDTSRTFTLVLSNIPVNRSPGDAQLTVTAKTAAVYEVPPATATSTIPVNGNTTPLDLMLDGDWSTAHNSGIAPRRGDRITIDLGSAKPVISTRVICMRVGDPAPAPRPMSLRASADGDTWTELHNGTGPVSIWWPLPYGSHAETPIPVRYLRLEMLEDSPVPAVISVFEAAALPQNWETVTTGIATVNKETSEFFFDSFSCLRPQVERGAPATLVWEGNAVGTEYFLYWDDQTVTDGSGKQIPVTGPTYTTHNLTDTTTFVLDAQSLDGAGQTVHHYLSTTVTVRNPDIRAGNVTVHHERTVGVDNVAATNAGGITIEGNVTLGDSLTLGHSKTLRTDRIAPSGTVPLRITDSAIIAAGKTLTVNGPLQVGGSVDIIGPSTPYTLRAGQEQTVTATTSGLVIGQAEVTGQPANRLSLIRITSGSQTVSAVACTFDIGRRDRSCAVLAVRKGEKFVIAHIDKGAASSSAPAHFYWIPFGFADSTRTTT